MRHFVGVVVPFESNLHASNNIATAAAVIVVTSELAELTTPAVVALGDFLGVPAVTDEPVGLGVVAVATVPGRGLVAPLQRPQVDGQSAHPGLFSVLPFVKSLNCPRHPSFQVSVHLARGVPVVDLKTSAQT